MELSFEEISTFDAENPIVGSLLRELDVAKKNLASDFFQPATAPPGADVALRNRLNKLKDRQEPKNDNNLSPRFHLPQCQVHPSGFPIQPPPTFQPLPETFLDSS